MGREMTPDEREEYEENRAELVQSAWDEFKVHLEVHTDDSISVTASLPNMVEFYINYRSEIEEML